MTRKRRPKIEAPPPDVQPRMNAVGDRILALTAALLPAVRPVCYDNTRGRPQPVGSCVLLRFGPQCFLATAAHVMDERQTHPGLYVPCDTGQMVLYGDYAHTRPPDGDRTKDRFDLAVLPLSDAQVAALGHVTFLTADDLAPEEAVDPTPGTGTRYLALGYPATAQPWKRDKNADAVPYPLALVPRPEADYAAQHLDPALHVLLEFEREDMVGPKGRTSAKHPRGMSGGGIFSVDLYGQRPASHRDRLVAVFIEYRAAPLDTITGTRIGQCVDVIRDRFSHLDAYLPRPVRYRDEDA